MFRQCSVFLEILQNEIYLLSTKCCGEFKAGYRQVQSGFCPSWCSLLSYKKQRGTDLLGPFFHFSFQRKRFSILKVAVLETRLPEK